MPNDVKAIVSVVFMIVAAILAYWKGSPIRPDFSTYIMIAAAFMVRQMAREAFPLAARDEPIPARPRWLAVLALLLWLGGVACGKLLLYTNTILLTTDLEW